MEPFYHPRLKDHEAAYAIRLRHTHERIKSGLLVMAGASTLYLQRAMNEDAYRHLLSKAEEAYREAAAELRELDPPASLVRWHRHYLDGFEDYKTALGQLQKLLGSAEKQRDRRWILAVAELMSAGTRKIKRVTPNLWLDEYITEHGEELDHQAAELDAEMRPGEGQRPLDRPADDAPPEPHEAHHPDAGRDHRPAGARRPGAPVACVLLPSVAHPARARAVDEGL
jgi:hypothetical protein